MPALVLFDKFTLALGAEKHTLATDTLKVALTNSAPNVATADELADITEIAYTNLSARTLTTTSWTQTSGTAKLIIADLVLTASGAVETFRYIVIYNDTATNDDLIGYIDRGSSLTMADTDTETLNFDGTAGAFTLAKV